MKHSLGYCYVSPKNSSVRDMGSFVHGSWIWDVKWGRDLFEWKQPLFEDLTAKLEEELVLVKTNGFGFLINSMFSP